MGAAKQRMFDQMEYEATRAILLRMMAKLRGYPTLTITELYRRVEEEAEDNEMNEEIDRLMSRDD